MSATLLYPRTLQILQVWIQSGKRASDSLLVEMYIDAVNAIKDKLMVVGSNGIVFVGELDPVLIREMEQLSCYLPGLLALGAMHA